MPTRKKVVVEGVSFDVTEPSTVALGALFTWVVWQFPRTRADGHSGAVHPPQPGHGWYPAIINAEADSVLVFAHLKERFPTPEAAARHIDQLSV